MQLKRRIKKLESHLIKPACFCGKTFIDLCYGELDTSELSYCPNCKTIYDSWTNLVEQAKSSENLTDAET